MILLHNNVVVFYLFHVNVWICAINYKQEKITLYIEDFVVEDLNKILSSFDTNFLVF